jgi:hypothetical protein
VKPTSEVGVFVVRAFCSLSKYIIATTALAMTNPHCYVKPIKLVMPFASLRGCIPPVVFHDSADVFQAYT